LAETRYSGRAGSTNPYWLAIRASAMLSWIPIFSNSRALCVFTVFALTRDIFLAQALGQQQRHFQLARRQAVERRTVAFHRRQCQILRDAGAQVAAPTCHVTHRAQQFLRITTLADISGRAGFEQPLRQRAIFQHRHDHHAGVAVAAHDALGHFHAAHTRQVQVTQHHIRQQLADFTQRVFAGLGFAHHLDVGFPRQNHLHPGADQRVVIHQVDSNRHSRTSSNAAIAGQARQGADTLQARSECGPGNLPCASQYRALCLPPVLQNLLQRNN